MTQVHPLGIWRKSYPNSSIACRRDLMNILRIIWVKKIIGTTKISNVAMFGFNIILIYWSITISSIHSLFCYNCSGLWGAISDAKGKSLNTLILCSLALNNKLLINCKILSPLIPIYSCSKNSDRVVVKAAVVRIVLIFLSSSQPQ